MPKRQRTHKGALADREDARVHGKLPSAYKHLLGPRPQLRTGDLDAATHYLERIEAVIDRGHWTPAEADRLYRLRKKWRARASGEDARFNAVGTRPGPVVEHTERTTVEDRSVRSALKGMNQVLAASARKAEARRRAQADKQREQEGV